MAIEPDDIGSLRTAITHALAIADEQLHYLIAAMLAQCLDELDRNTTDEV